MRRVSILVLALVLILSMTATAFGEVNITTVTVKAKGYGSAFNTLTHTIALETTTGAWYLYDANGTKVTSSLYNDMRRVYDTAFYTVSIGEKKGIIDSEGNVIVPAKYGEVEVVSPRWAYGLILTRVDGDQGDFYSSGDGKKTYYNVETCDFYYRGTLVGTLPRSGFDTGSYASAYGDYLQIKDRSGAYHHYSKEFVDSGINESGEAAYANRTYIHTGTGQTLWTESCTLTADEVKNPYETDRGYVIDLQGNKLFPYNYSYIGSFTNGVAYFKTNQGKYGLVDIAGNELLPGDYDEIDYSFYEGLDSGYVSVVKDGLAGLVSLEGKDTANTFLYPSNVVTEKTPFLYAKGMDGKYLVISAVAGELEQHFEDVSFVGYGCPFFVGKTADGKVAVYGLEGEVILENDGWRYTSDIGISRDGKFAYSSVRENGEYIYTLYTIDYSLAEEAPAAQPEETAALPDGHWICPTCGEERETAFCPNDGTPKPAPATWICPVCQSEQETAFCPNDGTKRPE